MAGLRRRMPPDVICLNMPVCYKVEIKYDNTTIALTKLDLFDPDAPASDAWWTIKPPWDKEAEAAGLQALRAQALNGTIDIDQCAKGCRCKLPNEWGDWAAPVKAKIKRGFSLIALEKTVDYRAHGTVMVQVRLKIGACIRAQPNS